MMMEPSNERRAPITPQLALRVAILGGVAFALFAIIFFRLWYLQVLSGDKFLAQATVNRVRELRIQAPRGKIVDRAGHVLVENKLAIVVELDPSKLPEIERNRALKWGQDMTKRAALPDGHHGEPVPIPQIPTAELRARFRRLGRVLHLAASEIQRRVVQSLVLVPYSSVRLKTGVSDAILSYISERPELFPGVTVERTYVRSYPNDTVGAQILGYVGEITPQELKAPSFRGVRPGALVGKDGLEREYDRYLRGVDGVQRIQVDANGRPVPSHLRPIPPVAGQQLRLTVDLGLERRAQDLLAQIGGGKPGAAIAMDPRDGSILAMASSPTFKPSIFTKPFTEAQYQTLIGEATGKPLVNRATQGVYPTGSTFKAVSALAALQSGVITPGTTVQDAGCLQVGEAKRCNAKHEVYGTVDLANALKVSSDVYFYQLGMDVFHHGGLVIQRYARQLGFGRPTGIDLGGEYGGTVPDQRWRDGVNRREIACRKEKKLSLQLSVYAAGAAGCGISDLRPDFTFGDNASLAVGQGDLTATPLQLAVAYAAIANQGRVVVPHLGMEIDRANSELVQRLPREPARRVRMDQGARDAVAAGLHLATSAAGGTSADVFAGWPQDRFPVFGKTGTAERGVGNDDQSWYVAYVPDAQRPIVVVATVERGGFGAATAAPIACRMLARWYDVKDAPCAPGTDGTL